MGSDQISHDIRSDRSDLVMTSDGIDRIWYHMILDLIGFDMISCDVRLDPYHIRSDGIGSDLISHDSR